MIHHWNWVPFFQTNPSVFFGVFDAHKLLKLNLINQPTDWQTRLVAIYSLCEVIPFCWTGGTKIPAAKGSSKRQLVSLRGPWRSCPRCTATRQGPVRQASAAAFTQIPWEGEGVGNVLDICWPSWPWPSWPSWPSTWRPIYIQASASRILWNCLLLIQCRDQESKAPIMGMTIKHGLWPITVPPAHITSLGFPNPPQKGNK